MAARSTDDLYRALIEQIPFQLRAQGEIYPVTVAALETVNLATGVNQIVVKFVTTRALPPDGPEIERASRPAHRRAIKLMGALTGDDA